MSSKMITMPHGSTCCLFLLFATVILLDPSMAIATDETKIETVLCNVLKLAQGGIGKSIAAFAIIFIGVSLFMGKVSWGLAISTAIGIGAIFGASSIVNALGGGATSCADVG